MRVLRVRYRCAADLLLYREPTLAEGGVFVPTREPIAVGEPVLVDFRAPELRDGLALRGTVVFRRSARRRPPQRAGVGIEFLPAERRKFDYLLSLAAGQAAEGARRRHPRIPVDLHVSYWLTEERRPREACALDISAGGAFLSISGTDTPPGTALVIEVTPPGAALPLPIEARVAWTSDEGVGVQFRCRDTGGLRRLKELVRRLRTAASA